MAIRGQRNGVIRGQGSNGAIMRNGHPPYSERAKRLVLAAMDVGRPVGPREISAVIGYSHEFTKNIMRYMTADGVIVQEVKGKGRYDQSLYTLPGTPGIGPRKVCTRCRQELPVESFHRDAGQADGLACRCRTCRSKHVTAQPAAPGPELREPAMAGMPIASSVLDLTWGMYGTGHR